MKPKNDTHNSHSFYAYNYWTKLLVKTVLSGLVIDPVTVQKIREAEVKGVVVYAIKHPSALDALAVHELLKNAKLPLPAYAHGVNTAVLYSFSELLKLLWAWFRRIFSPSTPRGRNTVLRQNIERGKSALFYLGSSGHTANRYTESALRQLIAVTNTGKEVIIVPLLVAYGRRREKEEENLFSIVLGQTEYTGSFRRLITFVRYARRVIVMAGEEVAFSPYLASHNMPTDKLLTEFTNDLITAIDKEKMAIIGPTLKSTKEIVNSILDDPQLLRFLEQMAQGDAKRRANLTKKARKKLQEIAAGYDDIYISFFDMVLGLLWNNIYDGLVIDKPGMDKIRAIAKEMPFIVIPCHRSHIDYLLLSYVLYHQNLPLPFIAAGANMQFWPMGPIFRRCGAFFLRRSFQGDDLYREVFYLYMKKLMEEGIPLEFFIEGGRSRTGKMVMPKYGILSMLIQAFQEGAIDDLALIPVYLGYDRIVEEQSYLQELSGGEKQTEKATDIIKSGGILRRRFGQVYVNVGEAITLKSYFASLPVSFENLSENERRALYRKIGYEVVLRISAVSVVTPFSLVASALLSHDYRGISHDDLWDCISNFKDYLKFSGMRMAETLLSEEKTIKNTILKFAEARYIEKIVDDEDDSLEIVYSLEDEKRLAIEYYKNNILHFFVPISFFALTVLQHDDNEVSLKNILQDYSYLKKLFRHEFIFDDSISDFDEIGAIMDFLKKQNRIDVIAVGDDVRITTRGAGRKILERFAALTRNYIESYWVTVRSLSLLRKKPLREKDFVRRMMRFGSMLHKKGEIRRAESLSNANYRNALRYLREKGLLKEEHQREKGEQKVTIYYSLVDSKLALEAVRHNLFRFIR
ncbi:MAG: 1-acyl-sn-glycerol-3-phosphate acyltransferase [Deltaproteobacteria bacterium]|nr:1-acyl-sn-glycerol-3-phosphate acyltransferase [Deltaproteobacteria bacterium]